MPSFAFYPPTFTSTIKHTLNDMEFKLQKRYTLVGLT